MQSTDVNTVLDKNQLRDITMDDPELMRDIVQALLTDTSSQVGLIESAIRQQNSEQCIRLAHYSKGACANVGANRAANICKTIEHKAKDGAFSDCSESLAALVREMDLLRDESATL